MSLVTEIEGDLFDAPDGAALIHACNCQGSWGKGIAAAFKARYPAAFRIYRTYCLKHLSQTQKETRPRHPEATALLIAPQKEDFQPRAEDAPRKKHWIVCLFTSQHYGPKKRRPQAVILENTVSALNDLKGQLERFEQEGEGIGELFACRFNAGLFGVQWDRTREVLERSGLRVTVVRPEGEME